MTASEQRCDQLTARGELCSRVATVREIPRTGKQRDGLLYCTQHANYYGVWRRRHEQLDVVKPR